MSKNAPSSKGHQNEEIHISSAPSSKLVTRAMEHALKSKELDLQVGWLGRIFGSPSNVPGNICGLLIFFMLGIGAVVILFEFRITPVDYWKIAQQLILPALTYLFGRGARDK